MSFLVSRSLVTVRLRLLPLYFRDERLWLSRTLFEVVNPKGFDEIPGPNRTPFLGNQWRYWPIIGQYNFDKIHLSYRDMYEEYGPLVKEEFTDRAIVHVFDAEDIKTVYENEGLRPSRISHRALEKYRKDRPLLYSGPGLFPSNGEEWYRCRELFEGVFNSPKNVQMMSKQIEDVAEDLVAKIPRCLDDRQEMDVQPELFKWAVETIAAISLDLRLGCLSLLESWEAKEVVEAAQTTQKAIYITENKPLWQYIPTISYRKLTSAQDVLAQFVKKYINRALLELKREGKTDIFLSQLTNVPGADEKDVFTMIMDMFLASIDTSACTTAFALYNLAQNPDVQLKLYKELKNCLPSKLSRISESKMDVPYLKLVVRESLRLNPIGIGTGRVLPKDLILSGYLIPAGTMVILQHQVASMLSENFKYPRRFLPERWEENSGLVFNENVAVPFGYGPRQCLGKELGEMEMLVTIAKIIRNFKVSYNYDTIGILNRLINVPDGPVYLHFESRDD